MASTQVDGRMMMLRVGVGVALALSVLARTDTAAAELGSPVRLGDAVLVNPEDPTQELIEGKSSTIFTLRLPIRATCPGDSANDNWRYQGFMVPVGVDPGLLVYNDVGPTGPSQFALFATNENPLSDALIDMNDAPGTPGVLPPIPPLSFAVFPPGMVAPGRYTIGIACTWFKRETSQWWDTEIVVSEAPDDKPGRLTWRLGSAPATSTKSDSGSSAAMPLAAGAAVVAVAAFAMTQRKRRALHPSHRTQEPR